MEEKREKYRKKDREGGQLAPARPEKERVKKSVAVEKIWEKTNLFCLSGGGIDDQGQSGKRVSQSNKTVRSTCLGKN